MDIYIYEQTQQETCSGSSRRKEEEQQETWRRDTFQQKVSYSSSFIYSWFYLFKKAILFRFSSNLKNISSRENTQFLGGSLDAGDFPIPKRDNYRDRGERRWPQRNEKGHPMLVRRRKPPGDTAREQYGRYNILLHWFSQGTVQQLRNQFWDHHI